MPVTILGLTGYDLVDEIAKLVALAQEAYIAWS
jgi:hypothetical protein